MLSDSVLIYRIKSFCQIFLWKISFFSGIFHADPVKQTGKHEEDQTHIFPKNEKVSVFGGIYIREVSPNYIF